MNSKLLDVVHVISASPLTVRFTWIIFWTAKWTGAAIRYLFIYNTLTHLYNASIRTRTLNSCSDISILYQLVPGDNTRALSDSAQGKEYVTDWFEGDIKSTELSHLFSFFFSSSIAPVIVTAPGEVYNVTGSQVYLSCEAIGIPTPVITWKKVPEG